MPNFRAVIYTVVPNREADDDSTHALATALLESGYEEIRSLQHVRGWWGGWHTAVCHEYSSGECLKECKLAKEALAKAGYLREEEV